MEVLINDVKEAIEKQYFENLKEKQRWVLNNNSFDYDAFNSFSDVSLKKRSCPKYFAKQLLWNDKNQCIIWVVFLVSVLTSILYWLKEERAGVGAGDKSNTLFSHELLQIFQNK